MTGLPWLEQGLPRDPRNTARETRARFEYQDACVVLRCIPNLLPGGDVAAVVIEWTSDYVVLARDGRVELVSVKHREEDQRPWTFGDLVREHVFRDLHSIWKQLGEDGDYVFESNRGFSSALRSNVERAANPGDPAAARLADVLDVKAEEAARFACRLILPPEPVPDRRHIRDVAMARLTAVMPQLGLDPRLARACVTALEERIAAVAVDRPPEPERRAQALAGLMREVRDHGAPIVTDYLLTMDELREVVAAATAGRHAEVRVRPPTVDPLFSGRAAELASLGRLLTPGPDGLVTPVVLTGMAGVGKSALAERFAAISPMRAHVIAADTRVGLLAGIHQLNPPSEPLIVSPAGGFATRPTGPPEPEIPDDPGLILVVDGLSEPSITAGLIPRASRTTILITTTSPHVDDGFRHFPVAGLTQADAEAYLSKVLPGMSGDAVALLIGAFDGNALGLVQGANYCLATGIDPGQYLERLRHDPVRLMDLGNAVSHPQTLAAAIRAGLAEACNDSAARALAGTLALLAPDPVPEWIFGEPPVLVERDDLSGGHGAQVVAEHVAALADPIVLDSAVMALARHGLASRGPGGLRMHQLVQEVARTVAGQPPLPARYEATVGLLLAALARDDVRPSPDVLTPHVAAVVRASEDASADPLVTSYLTRWLGNRHYAYGDLATAMSYLRQAADMASQPGLLREVLPFILHDLIRACRAAGEIDGALAAADEWADTAQSAGSNLEEFRARFSRVATLVYAGRFRQAAAEQSALAAQPKPAELPASDQTIELSVLAEIRRGLGDTEGAFRLVDEATRLARDQTTGLARADHLAALGSQGSALERDLGHEKAAVERQREAVSAARDLGLQMPLARQLQGLASRLLDYGDADEAAKALEEALEIAEAEGQESRLHADILQTTGRIALVRDDPGTASHQLAEAIPLLEAKGEHYLADLATAWYNLGTAQMKLSEPSRAASSYLRARDIEAAIYGENHPDLISTEYSLAAAMHACDDLTGAGDAINRCLRIIRQGGESARVWRRRALQLAILIDLADWPPSA
ncbi:MAG TPA: dsDNA nuclease domain-containing protein [Streptosporangiaceae bacterium]|nr:dsDNA nuclease domain-containing protein [Streptosporangiaceae bacterium]